MKDPWTASGRFQCGATLGKAVAVWNRPEVGGASSPLRWARCLVGAWLLNAYQELHSVLYRRHTHHTLVLWDGLVWHSGDMSELVSGCQLLQLQGGHPKGSPKPQGPPLHRGRQPLSSSGAGGRQKSCLHLPPSPSLFSLCKRLSGKEKSAHPTEKLPTAKGSPPKKAWLYVHHQKTMGSYIS